MTHHKPLVSTSPKQRQGRFFEGQALQFLQAKGLTLIAQNWQQPKVGELDLIMIEQGVTWPTLVFIEVRQRVRSNFGDAALSVTAAKQRKITKTAKYFLQQHPNYADFECRFDVVAYNVDADFSKRFGAKCFDTRAGFATIDPAAIYPSKSYQPEWLQGAFVASAW